MTASRPQTHYNLTDQIVPIPHWKFLHFKKAFFQSVLTPAIAFVVNCIWLSWFGCMPWLCPPLFPLLPLSLIYHFCVHRVVTSPVTSDLTFLTCPAVVTIELSTPYQRHNFFFGQLSASIYQDDCDLHLVSLVVSLYWWLTVSLLTTDYCYSETLICVLADEVILEACKLCETAHRIGSSQLEGKFQHY